MPSAQKKALDNRNYSRSRKGVIVRSWHAIQRRLRGDCKTPWLYAGLKAMPYETYLNFAHHSADFEILYLEWEAAGFPLAKRPTVDRKSPTQGYTLDNVRWLTYSDNAKEIRRAPRLNGAGVQWTRRWMTH